MPLETFNYKAGVSGTVSIPSNAAVKQMAAAGSTDATVQIGSGDLIDASLPFSEYPDFSLTGPLTITFTDTTQYYVSWVEYT